MSPAPVFNSEPGPDQPVAWHYGDPHAEQRQLATGRAVVDLSHRGLIRVIGSDRLRWLNDLVSQDVSQLTNGSALALILDPNGHIQFELRLLAREDAVWITTEPGAQDALVAYLNSMKFLLDVEVSDLSADYASVWVTGDIVVDGIVWQPPGEFSGLGVTSAGVDRGGDAAKYVPHRPAALPGREVVILRDQLAPLLAANPAAGTWALEALRVAAGVPRVGFETDHKTLPHEVGYVGPAVHLSKGCYRGQEAVARVHNLGRPPRRLVLLHLDGSAGTLPAAGDPVIVDGRPIGAVCSVARHYELGPVATAVIKTNVPSDVTAVVTDVGGTEIAATIEDVVVNSARQPRPSGNR